MCQYRNTSSTKKSGKIENTPQYWNSKLKAEPDLEVLRALRVVVAGETLIWLQEFVEVGGLASLFVLLGKTIDRVSDRPTKSPAAMKLAEENQKYQMEIIRCMTHVLNNKVFHTYQ